MRSNPSLMASEGYGLPTITLVHWTTETSAFIAAQRNILATIIQRFFLRRWSSRRQWRSPC